MIEYDSGMMERKIQRCMKRVVQTFASVLSKPYVCLPGLVQVVEVQGVNEVGHMGRELDCVTSNAQRGQEK